MFNNIARPLNLDGIIEGKGSAVIETNKGNVRITNLIGRVYIKEFDSLNPFESLDDLLDDCNEVVHIVDFHAEATGEKKSLAYYFDGRVSAVLGTHTHVQTADEQIINGMSYITDAGFCGASDGVIGMEYSTSLKRLSTSLPERYEIAQSTTAQINGVEVLIDKTKATQIKRINILVDNKEQERKADVEIAGLEG